MKPEAAAIYQDLCLAPRLEDAVALLADSELRLLHGELQSRCASGVPQLVTGALEAEAQARFFNPEGTR